MKHIKPMRIDASSFEHYGSIAAMPSEEPLAHGDTFTFWSDVAQYEICGETEIGYCTVYRQERDEVDWMERHNHTPELLVPIDAPFVLPVMTPEGDVEAFRVELGQAVVIGKGVWHSACKPIGTEEATYFVIFRRGTPQEDVVKTDMEPIVIDRT